MVDNSRAKNELQEFLQRRGIRLPLYSEEAREGLSFKAKVTLEWNGMQLSCYGLAPRKKDAEKAAAANMLVKIREMEHKPKTVTRSALPRQEEIARPTVSGRESGLSGSEHGKTVASVPSQVKS